jgi:hypothetical protein
LEKLEARLIPDETVVTRVAHVSPGGRVVRMVDRSPGWGVEERPLITDGSVGEDADQRTRRTTGSAK